MMLHKTGYDGTCPRCGEPINADEISDVESGPCNHCRFMDKDEIRRKRALARDFMSPRKPFRSGALSRDDASFLQWIHDRLENVHGENRDYDYMHKLRSIIAAMPEGQITPNTE